MSKVTEIQQIDPDGGYWDAISPGVFDFSSGKFALENTDFLHVDHVQNLTEFGNLINFLG